MRGGVRRSVGHTGRRTYSGSAVGPISVRRILVCPPRVPGARLRSTKSRSGSLGSMTGLQCSPMCLVAKERSRVTPFEKSNFHGSLAGPRSMANRARRPPHSIEFPLSLHHAPPHCSKIVPGQHKAHIRVNHFSNEERDSGLPLSLPDGPVSVTRSELACFRRDWQKHARAQCRSLALRDCDQRADGVLSQSVWVPHFRTCAVVTVCRL